MVAQLHWNYGLMSSGKSTLALQLDHTYTSSGLEGLRFTCHDRSGTAAITSRLGVCAPAFETTGEDLYALVARHCDAGNRVDFVVADEVQFYDPAQVEQLARIVDEFDIDVHAFGLTSDYASRLFPASARMFELADKCTPLPVQPLCFCGDKARLHGLVVNGVLQRERTDNAAIVGDVGDSSGEQPLHYVLLCRKHHVEGRFR